MKVFNIDSLTDAIVRGWASEGFQDVGYLTKFARGIAKGIIEEVTEHTVNPPVQVLNSIDYNVFDPTSVVP